MTRPVRRFGPGLFSVSLGFAGLAGSWRLAAPRVGAPGWIADAIAVVSLLLLLGVTVGWGRSTLREPGALADPAVAVLPITAGLLSVDLRPHAEGLAAVLFVAFGVLTVTAAIGLPWIWAVRRTGIDALHPGYLLGPIAGPLLTAQGAVAFGWHGLAWAVFALGCLAVAVLPPLVLRRLFAGPPLPPPLAPTLALGVAAPALMANTYLVIAGGFDIAAWAIVAVTTVGALVQVGLLGRYARAPFAPPTWAFAFAYATTASMTLRVIDHEDPAGADALRWTILAAITGLLITLSAKSLREPDALLV